MADSPVTMFTNANNTYASNIASLKSPGYKRQENVFNSSVIGSSNNSVSYVTGFTRNTNDIQGALITTGVSSDIAIEGAGMMLVTDSVGGTPVFTRRGDFRQDQDGFWKNGGGQLLLAWQLDAAGNLPANFAVTDSLTPVNFSNTKGTPKATTIFTPSLNLNAQQNALLGPGVTATMNPNGLNANTGAQNANDIILPDYIPSGGISLGDQFTFNSSSGQQPKTLVYGGIAVANAPGVGAPIFQATTVNAPFAFAILNQPVAANQVAIGATLQLNLGGITYNFNATQGAASVQNKTFNTITNLAAAINSVAGLSATIDTNGRLYIAPTDSTQSLSFLDLNGGTFAATLGLVNIPAAANNSAPPAGLGLNTYRFNSLASLNKAINDQNTVYSLKATINGGSIQINSLLASDNFTITGTSLGKNSFNSMTFNAAGTERGRATVTIPAPGNFLVAGDLVRISGTGNPSLPDGVYQVQSSNANVFTVNIPTALVIPGINAAAAATPALNLPVNTYWQKVPGATIPVANFANPINVPAGAIAMNVANTQIVITPNIAPAVLPAAGDIVYISGIGAGSVGAPATHNVYVPDGYYVVNVVGAGTFNITPPNIVPIAGLVVPLAAINVNNFTYQDVELAAGPGLGIGGLFTLNANVMQAQANPDANNALVRLYTTTNNYNNDDWITFQSLGNPTIINGITIANNTPYFVKAVDKVNGYIDFLIPGQQKDANAAVTATYGTAVFTNIVVDNISRSMNYLGINEIGSQLVNGVPTLTNSIYTKTYDPTNANTSLSSKTAFPTSTKWQAPIKLYDSLGGEFNIILNFAKLSNDTWAVEATAQPGPDGVTYDILQARAGDGFIGGGQVTFDTNGKFTGSTLNTLSISRTNGSAPSTITIDWKNQLSAITSGSVTQYSAPNDLQGVQQDGQSSGTMISYSVGDDGKITAVFDSGETTVLWQIPVGVVANINGLEPGLNGTFSVTSESGELILKVAGTGGSGKFVGKAVEDSNTDTTSELLELSDNSNVIRANARVVGVGNKNLATILQELS